MSEGDVNCPAERWYIFQNMIQTILRETDLETWTALDFVEKELQTWQGYNTYQARRNIV